MVGFLAQQHTTLLDKAITIVAVVMLPGNWKHMSLLLSRPWCWQLETRGVHSALAPLAVAAARTPLGSEVHPADLAPSSPDLPGCFSSG